MMPAETREVGLGGLAVVVPRDSVIEVAVPGAATAPWEGAQDVPKPDHALEVGWRTVPRAIDVAHRAGDRVGQNADEAGRVRREPARGRRVDRTVTLEDARLVHREG